jgi:hypothetical protein
VGFHSRQDESSIWFSIGYNATQKKFLAEDFCSSKKCYKLLFILHSWPCINGVIRIILTVELQQLVQGQMQGQGQGQVQGQVLEKGQVELELQELLEFGQVEAELLQMPVQFLMRMELRLLVPLSSSTWQQGNHFLKPCCHPWLCHLWEPSLDEWEAVESKEKHLCPGILQSASWQLWPYQWG